MIYAVGDIHGQYSAARALLCAHGAVDFSGNWAAGKSALVFTGDYFDRGPDGYRTVRWIRDLQKQASQEGGLVAALLGNHDMWTIHRCYDRLLGLKVDRRKWNWQGCEEADELALCADKGTLDWLRRLPVICKLGGVLFQHADAFMFYLNRGGAKLTGDALIADINRTVLKNSMYSKYMLESGNELCWARDWDGIKSQMGHYLDAMDAEQVVHGHTPMAGNQPYFYMNSMAVAIDGHMRTFSKGTHQGCVLKLHRKHAELFV